MKTKPALLVAALAVAALSTVGCEQRGANDTAAKSNTAPGSMQAQTQPSMNTPPAPPPDKMANAEPKDSTAQSVNNAASDAAITAKVKAAILAEPGLKSLSINVDTKNATVTLSGSVASDNLRDRAKQIAMSTEGVKNVVDNLTVKAS
jgi:hyperosmotically inducible protein